MASKETRNDTSCSVAGNGGGRSGGGLTACAHLLSQQSKSIMGKSCGSVGQTGGAAVGVAAGGGERGLEASGVATGGGEGVLEGGGGNMGGGGTGAGGGDIVELSGTLGVTAVATGGGGVAAGAVVGAAMGAL